MSSARVFTLEEFTSSTSPLPSILLPRSRALRLLELCELAEMTPPANVLDSGNDDDDDNGRIGSSNPPVLVTQMALLLYLGEYIHVRHLWGRHSNARVTEGMGNKGTYSSSNDHAQLELLWNAAEYCCLWNTGGLYSLTSSSSSVIDLASAPSSSHIGNTMQVEGSNPESAIGSGDEDNEGGSSTHALPYSTIALRALQSCASQNMEPLSTFSAELLVVFRSRVNRGLHTFFDKLDCGEFCLRMNLENPNAGEGGRDEVWNGYGWKEVGGYLVTDVDDVIDHDDCDEEKQEGGTLGEEAGRIERLTDIIMFLEGKMNA